MRKLFRHQFHHPKRPDKNDLGAGVLRGAGTGATVTVDEEAGVEDDAVFKLVPVNREKALVGFCGVCTIG